MVDRDAVQPGVDLSLGAEVAGLAEHLEEDFLGGVPGLLRVAEQAFAQPEQPVLVGVDELREGVGLPGGHPRQRVPARIGHRRPCGIGSHLVSWNTRQELILRGR
jgi:hypothetical protein